MQTLWDLIFTFFMEHVFAYNDSGLLEFMDDTIINFFGAEMGLSGYLSFICSTICVLVIFTLCALFIWKMVKLIGGLIR